MQLLTTIEREALLRALQDAPDEILIDAVRQRKDWMKQIRSSFDEVRNFVGMRTTEGVPPKLSPARSTHVGDSTPVVAEPVAQASRANKSPGAPSIGKIGTKTVDQLTSMLKEGMQPNHDKFGEHLKLMWSRKLVKYDGTSYYL